MLLIQLYHLFLAPKVVPAMAVQRHDSGRRQSGLLGDQHICGHAHAGRSLKGQVFLDVIAPVFAPQNFRLWPNHRRKIKKVVEYSGARHNLPPLQIAELAPQKRKPHRGTVGLLLRKIVQIADVGTGGSRRPRAVLSRPAGSKRGKGRGQAARRQVFAELTP